MTFDFGHRPVETTLRRIGFINPKGDVATVPPTETGSICVRSELEQQERVLSFKGAAVDLVWWPEHTVCSLSKLLIPGMSGCELSGVQGHKAGLDKRQVME